MINDFTKKEAPVLSTLGLGGGNASRSFLSGAVLSNRSLRFNDNDNTYLHRTPSSASNRQTWTWAAWVKRGGLGRHQYLFSAGDPTGSATNYFALSFDNNDKFQADSYGSGANPFYMHTGDRRFRDTNGWYHLTCVLDTTESTGTDRFKLYVNGSQVSLTVGTNVPPQDADQVVNSTTEHRIGRISYGNNTSDWDGYLTDIYFIDGSALTPSSFGSTDSNGVWQRSTYSGSYGTNGYHICDFANDETIGNDTSGQGNNYTANNFSTTAGSGNDLLFDFPTNDTVNTDSGAGGEVTGNYACINPLLEPDTQTVTLSNGNLDFSSGAASGQYGTRVSSIGVSSGKWYAEFTVGATSNGIFFGITNAPIGESNYIGGHSTSYGYVNNGQKYNNNSGSSYGASFTANDVIGLALDLDNGTLTFYKNGSSQGTAYSSLPSGTYFMGISGTGSATAVCNFGQREFSNAAPSNHKCLTTTSLPTPAIADGSDYFDAKLWTGTGSSHAITTYDFSPDFAWIKARNNAASHALLDTVRGISKVIRADNNLEEQDNSSVFSTFDSNGFTLGADNSNGWTNYNTWTYVGYAWDAGSSTVSNTDGDVTSQVRANTTAGFSIVKWTNNGNNTPSDHQVGHGLGVVPDLVITKRLNNTGDWAVYSEVFSNPVRDELYLNTTGAKATAGVDLYHRDSTTFGIRAGSIGSSGDSHIAYCFAAVAGYSAVGSFETNGNNDNVFVYTGFRPRFIIWKRHDGTNSWGIFDTARATTNPAGPQLLANTNDAESTDTYVDILSNGFKLRNSGFGSGQNYIYYSVAENPFQANGGLAR